MLKRIWPCLVPKALKGMSKCLKIADSITTTMIRSVVRCFKHSSRLSTQLPRNLNFWYNCEKKHLIDQFIMPNAVNMLKFRFKFKKIWDSKLSSLNKQVYARDATRWHTFLCKHLHIFLGLLQILIQLRSFTKFGMINRAPKILCLN